MGLDLFLPTINQSIMNASSQPRGYWHNAEFATAFCRSMSPQRAFLWYSLRDRYWLGECQPMSLVDIYDTAVNKYGLTPEDVIEVVGPGSGFRVAEGARVVCPYLDSKRTHYMGEYGSPRP